MGTFTNIVGGSKQLCGSSPAPSIVAWVLLFVEREITSVQGPSPRESIYEGQFVVNGRRYKERQLLGYTASV